MNARRPVMAVLVAASSLYALAVPAEASTTTTWVHKKLRCAGRKTAVVTFKMQGGRAVDSWVDNTCGRQYVTVTFCEPEWLDSPKCGATDVGPRTKTHLGPLNYRPGAFLGWTPECGDGPGTYCPF